MEVGIESLLEDRLGTVGYVFIVVLDNEFWECLDDTTSEVEAATGLTFE